MRTKAPAPTPMQTLQPSIPVPHTREVELTEQDFRALQREYRRAVIAGADHVWGAPIETVESTIEFLYPFFQRHGATSRLPANSPLAYLQAQQ